MGNAILTSNEVSRIKRDLAEGRSRKHIARAYQVGLETIARIARGDTWINVPVAEGARIDKLEAELLAPANLDAMAERLIALQEKVDSPPPRGCIHCANGVPIVEGKHRTLYGPEDCLN
jgi:hypothetical protein